MKLTPEHISVIRFALREAAEKNQERAGRAHDASFWQKEAETALALAELLTGLPDVEVKNGSSEAEQALLAAEQPKAVTIHPMDLIAEHGTADTSAEIEPLVTSAALKPRLNPQAQALLNAIDDCDTTTAARDVLRSAAAPDKRALAKHFNVASNDLLEVITRRARSVLLKAA